MLGPDRRLRRVRVLIDGRNFLSPEAARAAAFDYAGIGRPSQPARPLPAAVIS